MLKHLELSKASMGVIVVPSRLLWTLERCQGKSKRHSGKCAIQVRSPEEERSECSTVLSSNRRQPLHHLVPFIVHLLASAFAQSPESYGQVKVGKQDALSTSNFVCRFCYRNMQYIMICRQLESHEL